MSVDYYFDILNKLKEKMTKDEFSKIHGKSFYNFLLYYNQISGNEIRFTVGELIEAYFDEIQTEDSITVEQSRELSFKYLTKIG